jgi:hypothetical protein
VTILKSNLRKVESAGGLTTGATMSCSRWMKNPAAGSGGFVIRREPEQSHFSGD